MSSTPPLLSKAFDTVNHCIRFSKLEKCGIRGNSLTLISNYLTDRKQVVNLNNANSSPDSSQHTITFGVPQGSILLAAFIFYLL